MTFTGIPAAALDFYDDLETDNSKTFWLAHKNVYDEAVKAPLEALASELTAEFGTPKFFRPYRDVRFSKDKTPYKTHQGVYFSESRRYFHVSAAGLFVGGGYFGMESDQINRYRRAVDDDIASAGLVDALDKARKAKLEVGGDQLSRVPSGYDKGHPRAELLRHKALTLRKELGFPPWLHSARAKSEIVKAWRSMGPLVEWLDANVGASDAVGGRSRRGQ
ncbi:DUF2461 domain-containing protein [Jatrophihabitans telluris]|uniref:DUF2461 domain-containing protein n=1 Tax=Jatrophihabitans telluris TaxID=2038343 RepID=A0ABY4QUL9_9ACTN|nr:DUF2461 domain-containing protein [Jatrophihabitans telluris]UQX86766.1 DUF2461 domain-containing protein [Jatrophihabitans telluris]